MRNYDECIIMIDSQLKKEAYPILREFHVSPMALINSLSLEIIKTRKIPFKILYEAKKPIDTSNMSEEEIMKLVQEGADDVEAGRVDTLEEAIKILDDNLGRK